MTAFVHPSFSSFDSQQAGADRAAKIVRAIGAPLRRLAERVAAYMADHRTAAEDHKMWEMALADARVMADISRAMKQGAPNKVAFY
ncbi:hypothetical protein GT347_12685 [Xylophilus rhododendri]|uniref:Uncharacterized protein n=1 Tax=Xylophilus rhododendri TaxID=2697032 RepID=A0A857J495_9BURK|nr:hypothetical protein [Xylophilus rhododendri]QHI98770.1 hypothetical protein GT347_12685 [Xylophilus rhododendri]